MTMLLLYFLQFVDDKLSRKILAQARMQQEELEEQHGVSRYMYSSIVVC